MDAKKVRVHVFIEGYVQGVGFRWWCAGKANELGLSGWVRNLSDGRVEAVFEGVREEVEKMVEECKKGPPAAVVEHIDIIWEKASGEFREFGILPTS